MARSYVVTGAASGIGEATYKLLTERGNRVIGVDIHHSDVNVDLSTPKGRRDGFCTVIDLSQGQIDAVVACAGLAEPTPLTVSVNFFGVTEFLEGLLPTLTRSSCPRVAVTSSMAALSANSPALVKAMLAGDEKLALDIAQGLCDEGENRAALIYSSTKQALSRWVRRECIKPVWAGAGIPLNAVGPGIVETSMVEEMIGSAAGRAAIDLVVPMPLHHYMKPIQVGYLLAWLTSEENTHTTGQTIYIDGGADAVLRGDNIWA